MQSTVEEVGSCKKKISIEVSNDEIKGELNKEFAKIRENAVIPGFRKGKAPRDLLQKRFGSQITDEVKQNVINDAYQKALEENELVPLGMPEFGDVDFDVEKPLNFDITLEVKPQFELGVYKGLKVNKSEVLVTDEMIDVEITGIAMQGAPFIAVKDGQIEKSDMIIADSRLEVDGVIVSEDSEVEVLLFTDHVGNVHVPDLHKSLAGLKVGDDATIDVKLGDNFDIEDVRGKNGTLHVVVNDIKRPEIEEIDDEFAKRLNCESVDDLRDRVEMDIESRLKSMADRDVYNQLASKLTELTDFDLPEGVVASMAEEVTAKYKHSLIEKGEPLEKVEEKTLEAKDASTNSVIKDLKLALILEKIADKERIYVTDTEVEKKITDYARNYNITPDKMYNYLDKANNIRSLRLQLREEKTLAFIVKEADVSTKRPSSDETGGG